MRAPIIAGLRRLAWILPLLARAAATPATGGSDITSVDKCKTADPCRAACISCMDMRLLGTDYRLLVFTDK